MSLPYLTRRHLERGQGEQVSLSCPEKLLFDGQPRRRQTHPSFLGHCLFLCVRGRDRGARVSWREAASPRESLVLAKWRALQLPPGLRLLRGDPRECGSAPWWRGSAKASGGPQPAKQVIPEGGGGRWWGGE